MVDVGFELGRIVKEQPVCCYSGRDLNDVTRPQQWRAKLAEVVDTMGRLSSKAQGLSQVITRTQRLAPEQRVYLYTEGNEAKGLLKVGHKRLFLCTPSGKLRETEPLCVLDFYTHESCQRCGVGKALFEAMLARENVQPSRLAYDRPSVKFIAFLRKHYSLTHFVPQSNNFVAFNDFFEGGEEENAREGRRSKINRNQNVQLTNNNIIGNADNANIGNIYQSIASKPLTPPNYNRGRRLTNPPEVLPPMFPKMDTSMLGRTQPDAVTAHRLTRSQPANTNQISTLPPIRVGARR